MVKFPVKQGNNRELAEKLQGLQDFEAGEDSFADISLRTIFTYSYIFEGHTVKMFVAPDRTLH